MAKYIKENPDKEIVLFDEKLVKKIASDWVNISAKVKKTDQVMVMYDIGARQLATEVANLCTKIGARVWYRVRDMDVEGILVDNLSERNIARYFSFTNSELYTADVVFMLRAQRSSNIMAKVDSKKMALYNAAVKPVYLDYRVNYTNWQLIYWPTNAEAKEENMNFEDYVEMFFKSCNQDWPKIKKAHEILIKVLDNAKTLELYANHNDKDPMKRTVLSMSIEGMEFVNSTIDRNYPGSEVFSSPVKNSVNGQLYRTGSTNLGHEGKIVKDVFFEVKNGKIIEIRASAGQEILEEFLNRDEGASYFGEIAFGTNPGLRSQVFNPLLNEKVGGSFHITPGKAYEDIFENKPGKKVHTFNGNLSNIHWDITIMMLAEYGGGEVKVDGKTIQKDGKWLIPGLEVLSAGL